MNSKTNLGILLLLTAIFAFGVTAFLGIASLEHGQLSAGDGFRFGVAAGIAICGVIGLGTYSVLVIRKTLPIEVKA